MMKRSWGWVGLIALVVCLSMTFLIGCAKKTGLKSDTAITQDQKVVAKGAPAGVSSTDDQATVSAREKALREQAMKDKAQRDAAAKGAGKDAVDLKDIQIRDINFDYDKYDLTPAAQATLKAGAPAYLKYREYKLVVEGHCDERGTVEYNLALGQKRADESAKYLCDMGIEKERIKTISYGKEAPLATGNSEAAWAKNRRAHFVVFPPVK